MICYGKIYKKIMVQYISSWTIVNGATIITGMGYQKLENGVIGWNGLANVKLRKYWTATNYDEIIKAFNVNTNDVSFIYYMPVF